MNKFEQANLNLLVGAAFKRIQNEYKERERILAKLKNEEVDKLTPIEKIIVWDKI
jgi:hypothetical protein